MITAEATHLRAPDEEVELVLLQLRLLLQHTHAQLGGHDKLVSLKQALGNICKH